MVCPGTEERREISREVEHRICVKGREGESRRGGNHTEKQDHGKKGTTTKGGSGLTGLENSPAGGKNIKGGTGRKDLFDGRGGGEKKQGKTNL